MSTIREKKNAPDRSHVKLIECIASFREGFECDEKRKTIWKKKNKINANNVKNESSLPYRGADGLSAAKSCMESSFIILYKKFLFFFFGFLFSIPIHQLIDIYRDMICCVIFCTLMIESRSTIAALLNCFFFFRRSFLCLKCHCCTLIETNNLI